MSRVKLFNHQRILELYKMGMLTSDIAAEVGCSNNTVLRVLRQMGIFVKLKRRKRLIN